MTEAIETAALTKDYGSGRGIFDLDLHVTEGEVFGFLGPNGAGKTTTIRLLMGVIHATRGSARIFGLDCDRDSVAVKRVVGYCPGELPQFGGWRGSEIVAYMAGLRGDVQDAAITALARRLDLDLGRKYREYSHGNKQKLALVLAFMHDPRLVILDEPTTGLDPLHQQAFYGIVRDARAKGATIFVSSHVLSEVEKTCDRIALVRRGRLVALRSVDEIRREMPRRVVVAFSAPVNGFVPTARGASLVARTQDSWTLDVHGPLGPLVESIRDLPVADLRVESFGLEHYVLQFYSGEEMS